MLGGIRGNKIANSNPGKERMMPELGSSSKERTSRGPGIGSGNRIAWKTDCESREKKGVKVRFWASASDWRMRPVTEMGNRKDSLEKR